MELISLNTAWILLAAHVVLALTSAAQEETKDPPQTLEALILTKSQSL